MTTTELATAQAPFRFEQDWDKYDGMISWWNAKTLDRYTELSNMHPPRHGWFCAFSKVVDLFGAERAAKVKRYCAYYPLAHFVKGGER